MGTGCIPILAASMSQSAKSFSSTSVRSCISPPQAVKFGGSGQAEVLSAKSWCKHQKNYITKIYLQFDSCCAGSYIHYYDANNASKLFRNQCVLFGLSTMCYAMCREVSPIQVKVWWVLMLNSAFFPLLAMTEKNVRKESKERVLELTDPTGNDDFRDNTSLQLTGRWRTKPTRRRVFWTEWATRELLVSYRFPWVHKDLLVD